MFCFCFHLTFVPFFSVDHHIFVTRGYLDSFFVVVVEENIQQTGPNRMEQPKYIERIRTGETVKD